jgi:predicted phosphoadenosine phosphosulfate sulfurtransferase
MVCRVPGAATAARYARTSLYGYGNCDALKHPEQSWRDFILNQLSHFGEEDRKTCARLLAHIIGYHRERSPNALPDTSPDPLSGLSWKDIATIAMRGDLKGGRKTIATKAKANKIAEKLAALNGK